MYFPVTNRNFYYVFSRLICFFVPLHLALYLMNSNPKEKFARKTNCFQNLMLQFNDYYTEFTAKFQYLIVNEMGKNHLLVSIFT